MTKEEFTIAIRKLCELINNDEAVGDLLWVHESTVKRWKSGVACPLPRTREWVIKELKRLHSGGLI